MARQHTVNVPIAGSTPVVPAINEEKPHRVPKLSLGPVGLFFFGIYFISSLVS